MPADAVAAKFVASASMTVPVKQAEEISDAVLALEDVTTAELTALLRGRA